MIIYFVVPRAILRYERNMTYAPDFGFCLSLAHPTIYWYNIKLSYNISEKRRIHSVRRRVFRPDGFRENRFQRFSSTSPTEEQKTKLQTCLLQCNNNPQQSNNI